ncbi:hypothetical protein VTI28DRAFT_2084 [Corynascus sepedonium]
MEASCSGSRKEPVPGQAAGRSLSQQGTPSFSKPLLFLPLICRVGNNSQRDTLAVSTRPCCRAAGWVRCGVASSPASLRTKANPLSSASWSPGNGLAGKAVANTLSSSFKPTQPVQVPSAPSPFPGLRRWLGVRRALFLETAAAGHDRIVQGPRDFVDL